MEANTSAKLLILSGRIQLLDVEMEYENISLIQFQKGTQEMSCIVRECSVLYWTGVAGLESISK